MDIAARCHKAAEIVMQGGVICYPTEGVWGLGCNPMSPRAFAKLLSLKQRSVEKGVILLAAEERHIAPYAHIPDSVRDDLLSLWPGFVTCLLPKSDTCPEYLTGKHESVAVRITAYQPLRMLCLAAGSAVVSTSANRNGESPVADIAAARAVFGSGIDYYLDADLGGAANASRIIDCTQQPPKVIRE